jgi:hypothetical protein
MLFFTLSATDLQWVSLQKNMPRFDDYQAGDQLTKNKIVRDNLQCHPHIAAGWPYLRFRLFLKIVLQPLELF